MGKPSMGRVLVVIGVLLLLAVGFYHYQLRAEERASCMFLISVPEPRGRSIKDATRVVRLLVKEYPACSRYAASAVYRMVR